MLKDIALVATILAVLGFSSYIIYGLKDAQTMIDQKESLPHLWEAWKVQMSKSYSTDAEDAHRFMIFSENYAYAEKWNSEGHSSILGMNIFADLTNEEFKALYIGTPVEEMEIEAPTVACPHTNQSNLPASLDWRTQGAVSAVQNQGPYHTCWSFSVCSVLESLYWQINGALPASFSEQQLVDCVPSQCTNCNYGRPDWGLNYTAINGIEYTSAYPYYGYQRTCQYNQNVANKVNTNASCVATKNVTQLQGAVALRPVSTGIQGDQYSFQLYYGGVLTASDTCGAEIDHFPVTVGWTNYQGYDSWILKNSWGTWWGVNGFVYIDRDPTDNDGYGVCGILKQAVYPTH